MVRKGWAVNLMLATRIITPSAPLLSGPKADAPLDSECLFGERFDIADGGVMPNDGFVFGTLGTDGYQGWVPRECLGDMPPPTAQIMVPMSDVTSAADIKSPGRFGLSLGALVTVREITGERAKIVTANGDGFLPCRHLLPLAADDNHLPAADTKIDDWVGLGERLIGSPYKWGGRTAWGLDCSALVQLTLAAAGLDVPRDSGPQHKIGSPISDLTALCRGDLVFWHGHVGIMQDDARLLHANAHHMAVASEPLDHAVERIATIAGPVTALRRPVI